MWHNKDLEFIFQCFFFFFFVDVMILFQLTKYQKKLRPLLIGILIVYWLMKKLDPNERQVLLQ